MKSRFRTLSLLAVLSLGTVAAATSVTSLSSETPQVTAENTGSSDFLSFQPKKAQYRGQPVDAIDIHMHTGSFETMGPLGRNFLLRTLPGFIPDFLKEWSLSAISSVMLDPYGIFIGIKSECEGAGLSACGLFAVHAPDTWGVTTNETVIKHLNDKRNKAKDSSDPFFLGFATISLQNWEKDKEAHLENLRKSLDNPHMKAIKLAFIHNTTPLDDRRFDAIYDVAMEKDVPVYHHVGSSPLRNLDDFKNDAEKLRYLRSYDPRYLEESIARYPEVTFILGHMGFDFNKEGFDFSDEVYALARKYPNVYLEISAFGRASYDPNGAWMDGVLRRLKSENLLERTLYGSDGPGTPGATKKYLESTLKSMERVGYTYSEAELVLGKNSRKLFKME